MERPGARSGRWSAAEDERLRRGLARYGAFKWKLIARECMRSSRTATQCMHRWNKVLLPGLVKGPWTAAEDAIIVQAKTDGIHRWASVAKLVP